MDTVVCFYIPDAITLAYIFAREHARVHTHTHTHTHNRHYKNFPVDPFGDYPGSDCGTSGKNGGYLIELLPQILRWINNIYQGRSTAHWYQHISTNWFMHVCCLLRVKVSSLFLQLFAL